MNPDEKYAMSEEDQIIYLLGLELEKYLNEKEE